MKQNILSLFFLFYCLFLNTFTKSISVIEKQGLDVICIAYNITTDVNFDYCSIPNIIGCDSSNSSVKYLNLIGDSSNMTPFPNNTIGNLPFLYELKISNSILWDFFDGIGTFLNKVTLNNTILYPTFPEDTKSIKQLSLYDTQFSGNINSSLILNYRVFELIYTDGSLMRDYLFIENDVGSGSSCDKIIVTVNNFFKLNYFNGCSQVTFILGEYFNDFNLTKIQQFKGGNFTIIDDGLFNKPFLINEKQMVNSNFHFTIFKNIQFNFTGDGYVGFKNPQSILFIENCSGLSNSPIEIKFDLFSFKNIVLSKLNLTILPEASFFEKFFLIDLSNNKFSGPLPELILPSYSNFSVKNIVLKGNNLSGSIPQSYCYHYVDLSDNQLSGDLPMCFICSLKSSIFRETVNGNNFSNYQSGQTNEFPQCSGITFTAVAKGNSPVTDFVTGTNFGWNNAFEIDNIFSTPDCRLFITIPNYELSTKLYYITIDQIKQANYKSNVLFVVPNLNVSLPIEIIPPKVNIMACSPTNGQYEVYCSLFGVGFVYVSNAYQNLVSVYLDNYNCNVTSVSTGAIHCIITTRLFDNKNYTVLILNTYSGLSTTFQYSHSLSHGFLISSIISPPRRGGIVTMTGVFTNSTSNDSVMIGNNLCPIQSVNISHLTCVIGPGEGPLNINITNTILGYYLVENIFFYQDDPKQCLESSECNKINGGGVCNPITGKCECSNYYQGLDCSFVSHFVSSIIPSTTNGGNTTLFGWFGNNHFNAKVLIGNKECYPIYKINSTTLTCLAPPATGLYSINITQNLIEYSLPNSYQYIPIKRNCPNDCTSTVNGVCNHDSGYCYCLTNWYGFDCSIYVIKNNSISPPTNTTIDPGTGITNITNEYTQFQISILKLIELNLNNLQVNQYLLNDKWIFSNNSNNNNNIFTFIQTIQNFTCNITYIIEEVKENKNITFAGIEYLLDQGSIKMTVSIENYSYKSSLNTLQLQMKSSTLEIPSLNKNDDDCNSGEVEIGNKNDQDNSLNFITIKKDDKLLSGRFINKVESDGRPTIISTNVILKDKDSIIIGMNLPHCTTKCLIDPDFSLIITPNFETECSESNKRPWLIPVAVVVPVVGISIIVTVYYFYKKQIVEKGFTRKLKMVELLNKKN